MTPENKKHNQRARAEHNHIGSFLGILSAL